jgi:hypothetical protein
MFFLTSSSPLALTELVELFNEVVELFKLTLALEFLSSLACMRKEEETEGAEEGFVRLGERERFSVCELEG